MVAAWLTARWWGITDVQTITRGQRKLLIAAGVLFSLSWLPFPRLPKFSRESELRLPSRLEFVVLVLLAVLIVTVDISWSRSVGLLAYPPIYDGIHYVFDAKWTIYVLGNLFDNPEVLRNHGAPNFSFTPLWKILLLLHFSVLGVGEWQAYSVRFWPTFLLLFLVFWLVRNQSNRRIAWMAVAFTALLPTLSVNIRATVRDFYVSHSSNIDWYLADLRPDLLFAVLLLWAVAPLVQYAHRLDSRLWLITGSAAALALLTKPSAGSLLALAWGIALLAVLFINWSKARDTLTASLWGFAPFFLLVIPWVAFGGLGRIFRYVYQSAVAQRELWSDANATLWSEFTYYWQMFSIHLGVIDGLGLLACALVGFGLTLQRNVRRRDFRASAYLIIALILYGIVSASPSKNFFLGLPFFLVLWLFAWTSLAPILKSAADKSRIASVLPAAVAVLYPSLTFAAFGYAAKHWPADQIRHAAQTRATIQELVYDVNQILTGSDRFLSATLFGVPAAFYYYMIQRDGSYPRQCPFDPLASPPERIIEKLGVNCKTILLYRNHEDQRKYSSGPLSSLPRWQAVSEWVKNPRNNYRLVKSYRFSSPIFGSNYNGTAGSFTMDLYVLDTASGGAVGS
jgi:4-amino-4-deoxy-L-arabinose transferase-like glycosyltransferase